jgi:hypothetical protein
MTGKIDASKDTIIKICQSQTLRTPPPFSIE